MKPNLNPYFSLVFTSYLTQTPTLITTLTLAAPYLNPNQADSPIGLPKIQLHSLQSCNVGLPNLNPIPIPIPIPNPTTLIIIIVIAFIIRLESSIGVKLALVKIHTC
jgi:hypothetical protein